MTPTDFLIPHLNATLIALTLVGLVVNGRDQLCRSFFAYCVACLVGNRVVTYWPEVFYTPAFWSAKESLYSILTLAVAVEIGLLSFSQFPRARATVILATTIVAGVGVVALFWPHEAGDPYWEQLSVFAPRSQAGTIAILTTIILVARYYRIPLHRYHRGIVAGFAFYLTLYTVALSLVREFGWAAYSWTLALDRVSYAVTMSIWAWTAWRRAARLTPVMRRLQPWAVAS